MNNEIPPQEAKVPQVLGNSAPTWLVVAGMLLTVAKLWLVIKNTSRAAQHITDGSQTLKFHVEMYHKEKKKTGVGSRDAKVNNNPKSICANRTCLSTSPLL